MTNDFPRDAACLADEMEFLSMMREHLAEHSDIFELYLGMLGAPTRDQFGDVLRNFQIASS